MDVYHLLIILILIALPFPRRGRSGSQGFYFEFSFALLSIRNCLRIVILKTTKCISHVILHPLGVQTECKHHYPHEKIIISWDPKDHGDGVPLMCVMVESAMVRWCTMPLQRSLTMTYHKHQ